MKSHYIAVLFPAIEGGYTVMFPDVPEAATQGDDVSEAMDMAADVLGIAMEEYALARKPAPKPSTLADVMTWAVAEAATARGIDRSREILYPLIAAPETDDTPVRVTISLTRRDLAQIDEKARRAGLPRSKFLARAALGI